MRALQFAVSTDKPDPIGAEERWLYEAIRKVLGGAPSTPETWTGLEWFPRTARFFPMGLLRHPELRRRLTDTPLAAWYSLTVASPAEGLKRYEELASSFETTVMSDGETLMLYLAWAQKVGANLPRPFSAYRLAMARDPWVGIRWARSVGDSEFARVLIDWSADHCTQHASAAWVMSIASKQPPESFRPVLALDPYYACIAAASTGIRFRTDEFAQLSPRWLYHLLVANALEDHWTAEERLYNEDPGWGLEYLIERNKHRERSEQAKLLPGLRAWRDANHPAVRLIAYAVDNLIPKD